MSSQDKDYVRNANLKRAGQRYSITSAFKNAGSGVVQAFKSERNLKIDTAAAVIVCVLGAVLKIDLQAWVAIVICVGIVFALEVLNTAIEAAVDLAHPAYHSLARRAKDCAAGAVLLAAIMSVVVGLLVFVPAIFSKFGFVC